MKVFSVVGISQSGKTTIIENIIKELRRRNYSVGSVKEIHFEDFAIDMEGSNTHRHKEAGSQLVTARGFYETDILFQEKLAIDKILEFYDHDFVVLEGVADKEIPKIVSAHNEEDALERVDDTVFAISGRISNTADILNGIPVINSMDDVERLVDLLEERAYDRESKSSSVEIQINRKIIPSKFPTESILSRAVLKTLKELEEDLEGKEIKINISY